MASEMTSSKHDGISSKSSLIHLQQLLLFAVILTFFFSAFHSFGIDRFAKTTNHRDSSSFGKDFDIETYFRAQRGELHLYRETVYPNTPEIQLAIHTHQHPFNCEKARYLIHEPSTAFGFGAVYMGIARSLVFAIATNRILVIKSISKPWPLSELCDTPGPQCFFLPETWCTPPTNTTRAVFDSHATTIDLALGNMQIVEFHSRTPYMKDVKWTELLPLVYAKLGVSPPMWTYSSNSAWRRQGSERMWNTQALLYLTRLNNRMQNSVRTVITQCMSSGKSLGTVGVPMRGSDKCYKGNQRGEMDCVDPSEVRNQMQRIRYAHPWLHKAIVTSEDRDLERRTKKVLEQEWSIISIPDTRPGTGRPGEQTNKTIAPYLYTEAALKVLSCQLTANTHLLTPKSNFHSMIDLLAKVVPGRTAHFTYSMGTLKIR